MRIERTILVRAATALALVALLAACSPLGLVNSVVPNEGYELTPDIAYGPAPRQRLDVYRPTSASPTAQVLVFFYGGAWKSGDRRDYRFVGQTFASRGFTVVIPDYRLYPDVRFPAFVQDAATAVAWTERHLARPGRAAPRIVLAGHSAGAHIAALLALDESYLAAAGTSAESVAAVVGLAGPYAFDPTAYRSIRPIFASAADPARARPVSYARPAAPPMLLLHGSDDTTVRPENSQRLAKRLQALGSQARYLPLEDVGHIEILLALAKPFDYQAPVVDETVAFIDGL